VLDVIEKGAAIWGGWLAADADAAAGPLDPGWLLEGAAPDLTAAALLQEVPLLDAAWRRFPRREAGAATLRKGFGQDGAEAWWSTLDGSARLLDR
jgi:hypothetical protein